MSPKGPSFKRIAFMPSQTPEAQAAYAQLEARYSVTDSIGLVGFYDVGQITAGEGWSGNSQWHAGAGVGVRYNTGIGPIRLDIGTPASGDNIGKNVQVYIGIGQSF